MKRITTWFNSSGLLPDVYFIGALFIYIMFLYVLVGCSGIPIPDVPIGRPLDQIYIQGRDAFGIMVYHKRPNPLCMKEINEPECGFYAWTVSDRTQYVGESPKTYLLGKPWSKLRLESLTLPTESLARIKESLMIACKQHKCSNPEVAKWRVKLDAFDSIGNVIKP